MKKDYSKYFSESKLLEKAKHYSKSAGIKVIYSVLVLFYTLQKPEISMKDRAIVVSALGYFILPFDAIPDFIPFAGYSDDFAALAFAIMKISRHIDQEVKDKAKRKLNTWFNKVDPKSLIIVEDKIF
ncbi:YkvA family protein [Clostridium paridis]|uniref:DUF1232 domain-containing protein n=1 Tax=Clostridium paridis TaxID=2803863 RepID=A0A937K4T2_9CLOT|nr:YkvA family protein [Clostridium paridis]MBL4932219.1 DUF1232 domain-containing protein [Clostridium paridis]